MQTEISVHHTTIDNATQRVIKEKFERLYHFVSDPALRLEIHVIQTTHHHLKGAIFEVTAKLHFVHGLIDAKAEDISLFNAADRVKEELERQLLKYKSKHQTRQRITRDKVREMRGKE